MPLPHLMVAPNGARLQKTDHPMLPITIEETVSCALDCFEAGADGLHLHIRDTDRQHLLDAGVYREALAELAQKTPELPVQITTEANGIYDPDIQRQVALNAGAKMVSVSVREMMRDGVAAFQRFYLECADRGIAVQHILYDVGDCASLEANLPKSLFEAPDLQLIFVLGRYSLGKDTKPGDLQPFLSWLETVEIAPDWAVCAFGKEEAKCLLEAKKSGGKCRIGFENSLYLPDGTIAPDNAAKVRAFLALS